MGCWPCPASSHRPRPPLVAAAGRALSDCRPASHPRTPPPWAASTPGCGARRRPDRRRRHGQQRHRSAGHLLQFGGRPGHVHQQRWRLRERPDRGVHDRHRDGRRLRREQRHLRGLGKLGRSAGLIGTSTSYIGANAISTNHWGLHAKSPTYPGVFEGSVFVTGQVIALGGVFGCPGQARAGRMRGRWRRTSARGRSRTARPRFR